MYKLWYILMYYRSIYFDCKPFYVWFENDPMDTSSSISHRFNVEIPCGKFVKITSILKDESYVKIVASIRCGNLYLDSIFKIDEISMSSPHGFFFVVSMSNWGNICIRYFYSIISWHFLLWEPIISYYDIVPSWCNFNILT